jgi:pyruvate formate lyase activating enzyme
MVSNGFLSEAPLIELLPLIDAFNIDLKAFSEERHKRHTGTALQPVLDNLIRIRQAGRHLEITSLVVPGVNDDEDEFIRMISWIRTELGQDSILHLSRYHPMYKMKESSTPADLLRRFHRIAGAELHYVYIGNLMADDLQDTRCGNCGEKVILRRGFEVDLELNLHGTCRNCGTRVATME